MIFISGALWTGRVENKCSEQSKYRRFWSWFPAFASMTYDLDWRERKRDLVQMIPYMGQVKTHV